MMNLKETGCEGVGWIHLAQDRVHWQVLVNMVMNLGSVKGGGFLVFLSNYQLLKEDCAPWS
jgi:hypothetical protein